MVVGLYFGSTPDSGNERVSKSCACFGGPFLHIGLPQPVLMGKFVPGLIVDISCKPALFSGEEGEMAIGERGSGGN